MEKKERKEETYKKKISIKTSFLDAVSGSNLKNSDGGSDASTPSVKKQC